MTSEVSICSNALLLLGDKPISSLTENTDRARIASNLYPAVRDAMLRRHPWNCAVKRVTLSPEVATPDFDYAYQFAMPGDLMRILQVGEYGCEDDYQIEGLRILADTSVLRLRYVWKNTDVPSWDALLVDAITGEMAARMAYPITKSASLQQVMEAKVRDTLRQARAVDGMDNPPETLGDYHLLSVRHSGRGV